MVFCKNFISLFVIVALGLLGLSMDLTAATNPSQEYIDAAIIEASYRTDVPHELLRAICYIESNLTVEAFVHNDGGEENHAYGMCQVLRKTSEKYVGKDKGCLRDFRNSSLKRNSRSCKLFGPKVNALSAAYYLKEQIVRYNGHVFKAAAAFNSGSLRQCNKNGWVTTVQGKKLYRCKPGDLLNRQYVNRVRTYLALNSVDMKNHLHHADFTLTCHRGRRIICM